MSFARLAKKINIQNLKNETRESTLLCLKSVNEMTLHHFGLPDATCNCDPRYPTKFYTPIYSFFLTRRENENYHLISVNLIFAVSSLEIGRIQSIWKARHRLRLHTRWPEKFILYHTDDTTNIKSI